MSSQNIRWLHLSDFHVGMDDYAQRGMFDYIIAHVRQRIVDGFVPDFIFITGDLANKGKSSEYETFWLEFIAPLQEVIGGGISERTFAIPGNHDVDRGRNPHFDRAEMAAVRSHCFDANEEGQTLRQMLMPRFQAFVESDCTLAKGKFGSLGGSFGKMIELRGCKVGITGINTAWLCKDDNDERKLTPGKTLLEYALGKLGEANLRVVLGHHPIDWLIPSEQKPIKSLLGQHGVLYLHGHLHDAWVEPTYGGGHQFLAVQSGAAFDAREGEKWRNGLVWGEADLVAAELKLQPRHWSVDHQDWTLAADAFPEQQRKGDWWSYPLPGTELAKRLAKSSTAVVIQTPKGWAIAKSDDLRQHLGVLDEEAAIRFFNGAVPGWHTALSSSIPRRQIVASLVSRFQEAAIATRPIVTLLLAAACEGKTTALLQAAYEVVKGKSEWQILRRTDDAQPLNPSEILPLLSKQGHWLVVLDEADRAADSLFSFLSQIPQDLEGGVHFLLACRDSDWQASGAGTKNWSSVCLFGQERLAGLDKADAQAIVATWAAYGKAGLGDLANIDEPKRAEALEYQAHEEAKTTQGAFFGALLSLRHGSDLPNHARLMLERLGQRSIPSGGTLRDALAFIAAMHTEGLEFLSRPVLARVLGCPSSRLHKDVIAPLGQEAAATTTSSFIFTRHRRIAEAVISVLKSDFSEDIGELYVELAKAAISCLRSHQYLPENPSEWRYRIAEHFFTSGRKDLALNIATGVLSCEPEHSEMLVKVANLYRNAGVPSKAVELFRGFPTSAVTKRGFFYEWANAEGNCGDYVASVILAGFSISDDCSSFRVDNNQAKLSLAGLGMALGELFAAHRELTLRDARIATAVLGQELHLDSTATSYFRKHLTEALADGATTPTVDQSLALLIRGLSAAETLGVSDVVKTVVPDAGHLEFKGLNRLIYASMEAKRR